MQLLDELAMIYTTCIMFYAIFSHGYSQSTKALTAAFLVLLALAITLYYHHLKDPVFHQNAFTLLTIIVLLRSLYTMETTLRPSRRQNAASLRKIDLEEQARKGQRDLAILKTMWQIIPLALGSVALGSFIWNLENATCGTLRQWRREIGLPWGILLEAHGWW